MIRLIRMGAWMGGVAALVIALAGCMTRVEGDRLAREATERERRLTSLEEGIEEERTQLQEEVERAQAKVAELGEVLEQATSVVKRNSADLGQEVRQTKERIDALEGKIDELNHELEQMDKELGEQREETEERITSFARRAGVDMALDDSEIPEDREAHFEAARESLDAEEHSKARALLREYLRRYADDDRAHEARYMLGKSYLAQGKPATALGEFRKVLADHGDSDSVDDTLFGMAEAFYALNSCSDAKSALQALLRAHSKSPLAGDARKKLREIRKNRKRCTD